MGHLKLTRRRKIPILRLARRIKIAMKTMTSTQKTNSMKMSRQTHQRSLHPIKIARRHAPSARTKSKARLAKTKAHWL